MSQASRMFGQVCIGLAVALLVLAGTVRAANVDGAWANGATNAALCTATVSNVVSRSPLPVNDGDYAVFHYNVSWTDTRRAPSPSAIHSFHLKAQWAVTSWVEDWYNVTTTGDTSGSASRSVRVYADAEYVIVVTWGVSLMIQSTCSRSDSDQRTVVLDLP